MGQHSRGSVLAADTATRAACEALHCAAHVPGGVGSRPGNEVLPLRADRPRRAMLEWARLMPRVRAATWRELRALETTERRLRQADRRNGTRTYAAFRSEEDRRFQVSLAADRAERRRGGS